MEFFKRKKLNNQEKGINLTLEQLKQFSNYKFDEIYDYLDYLAKNIDTVIDNAITARDEEKYHIGKIIIETNNVNPATYLGFGTWQYWGSGRVPVGVDTNQTEFNQVEKLGGEKTHTLTIEETPEHNHELSVQGGNTTSYGFIYDYSSDKRMYGGTDLISEKGGGQPHNNLQPYITCFMWKRIA